MSSHFARRLSAVLSDQSICQLTHFARRRVTLVIRRGNLLLAAVGMIAVLASSGCGEESPAVSEGTPAAAPTASTTDPAEKQPDKLTGPAPADREVTELTGFISPSGNVACMIDPSWVRCDIIDNDWSPPPRPADCEFDYGQGISLAPGAPAEFVCAGDTAFGPDEVLPYGSSIAAGVLECESAESGVTCRDVDTGHGFSISRQEYQLF
jgi:uncharacterized protein DUF6636